MTAFDDLLFPCLTDLTHTTSKKLIAQILPLVIILSSFAFASSDD